ncbi:MAG: lamin tail domain-containing protein, partial [bacterium]|nr:lamin tail domain-containing protein [bacterium]
QVAIGKFTFLQSQDSGQNFVIAQKRGGSFTRDTEDLTTDNDIISQSTWDRLSVKAVQYGAGVVDLFFNEVEKLKKDPKFKPVEPKSLLGQFIDSIGENVGALVAGAPEPQPVAVVPIVPQLIIEEVVEPVEPVAPAPVPEVTDTTPVPIAPVILPVIQPVPVPVAPIPKVTTTSHSGGGGGDTDVEAEPAETEDVEEVVEDPPAEEEVVPEPEPEPEPEIDTTPPIDIEDLEAKDAQENTVTLEWTAPGDDGEIGTATSYELRYSPNSITDENWASTTSSGLVITPQAAGESESVEISGLAPMTTYYFALKAKDEAGNESALSNIASATTLIAKPNHIVISEVYPDMVGNDVNEIVELYNPTDAPINISGYSLQYLSGGATALLTAKKNFVSGATVPAKGFYLIGMWGNPAADMVWSESLHNTGATVFLVNDQLAIVDEADVNIVDRVAYGTGTGLLKPEGTITSLPGEGKSIERKALIDGMCQSAAGEEEFSGNGCDTGDNANDFEIRTSPKAQRTTNLFEPRNAPSAVSNSPAVLSNNAAGAQLQFAWSASLDASGNSSGMIYKIIDTSSSTAPVQLYNSSSLSFAKTINEIGREYKATIQAIDKDGLASAITELAVEVPGYLQELAFYRDPASASSSPSYLVRLVWDNYPFVPVGSARWHLAVFYYNKDAEKLAFLGQLNSGHNWGAGVSMPSAFKTSYKNCFSSGYTNNASSLILPDDAAHCSGLLGNIKASAIDFGLLRDKVLVLPVLPQTFGGVNPVAGQDYITVAYYFYSDGNSLGSDQRLIAVDKTRYYLEP